MNFIQNPLEQQPHLTQNGEKKTINERHLIARVRYLKLLIVLKQYELRQKWCMVDSYISSFSSVKVSGKNLGSI